MQRDVRSNQQRQVLPAHALNVSVFLEKKTRKRCSDQCFVQTTKFSYFMKIGKNSVHFFSFLIFDLLCYFVVYHNAIQLLKSTQVKRLILEDLANVEKQRLFY